jgi:hypothetical protein
VQDAGAKEVEVGAARAVRTYLHPLRAGHLVPRSRPAPPTVREITGAIRRHPDSLDLEHQVFLDASLLVGAGARAGKTR